LKSVDHHKVRPDRYGVDRAVGIAAIFQSDLEYAAIYSFEWFGDIGLATFGRDRQRPQQGGLGIRRISRIPGGRLLARRSRGLASCEMLSYLPTFVNGCDGADFRGPD